jgi:hypothetical protein
VGSSSKLVGKGSASGGTASKSAVVVHSKVRVIHKVKKRWIVRKIYHRSSWPQPNVIFGGWILPIGTNANFRLAWSSQEVLNSMLRNQFQLLKEKDDFISHQFREFYFTKKKTDLKIPILLTIKHERVWLRVGPSQPPGGLTWKEVLKIRHLDFRALNILRRELRWRLQPRDGSWETPFQYHTAHSRRRIWITRVLPAAPGSILETRD